jgi:hypothetical protein
MATLVTKWENWGKKKYKEKKRERIIQESNFYISIKVKIAQNNGICFVIFKKMLMNMFLKWKPFKEEYAKKLWENNSFENRKIFLILQYKDNSVIKFKFINKLN